MSAHGKHELEQYFVGGQAFAIAVAPQLPADLAEFAGPIRKNRRSAGVLEQAGTEGGAGVGGRNGRQACAAFGAVEPAAEEPAASELVIGGDVKAKRRLEQT